MKFGIVLPEGDARAAADLAREAEQSGWDGFFVWEPIWGIDAWVALTAAAMQTTRIRLGTLLTPLSRLRPWKLASETVTLDHLSNGRVILAVGLGAIDTGFEAFGEVTDRQIRAELMDEGLDILTGLWRGQPFTYHGKHYQISPMTFPHLPPPPLQQPRIPIWVVGMWPRMKSMRRVLRYDGLLPAVAGREPKPDDIRAMRAYIEEHRIEKMPFDIIIEGKTPGDKPAQAAEIIRPWVEAGGTWWIESRWEEPRDSFVKRLRQGPPVT